MPSVRRLTAILAADVGGYSRLMGADEEGTHERLKSHFVELVNPKIKEHRGRIVAVGLLRAFGWWSLEGDLAAEDISHLVAVVMQMELRSRRCTA
jgi:class 3 adenylate cyclase